MNYRSIQDPIEFGEQRDARMKAVVSRLIDIRKAQVEHFAQNDKYAGSFRELIDFVNNGSIPTVKKVGGLTDEQMEKGLTEALETVIKSFRASNFSGSKFLMSITRQVFLRQLLSTGSRNRTSGPRSFLGLITMDRS